jgi:hypothetical protein
MEGIGWEIQPAGWLLLVILGIFLIYSTIRWLQRSSNKNPGNI